MQAAHNTPPNVGFPHAGQVVMRFPSGGVLMATAVFFRLVGTCTPSIARTCQRPKTQGSDVFGPPLNTNCSTVDGPGPGSLA